MPAFKVYYQDDYIGDVSAPSLTEAADFVIADHVLNQLIALGLDPEAEDSQTLAAEFATELASTYMFHLEPIL